MEDLIKIAILIWILVFIKDVRKDIQETNKILESIRITQTTVYKDSVSSYRDLKRLNKEQIENYKYIGDKYNK
jgi:hypothetical protein